MTNIITDARDRLMSLCETIALPAPLSTPNAFKTRQECSFTTDDLPAFIVEEVINTGRNTRISADSYMMQREFNLIMALTPIQNEAFEKNMDAWDLVRDCILVVTDFFMGNPELSLSDDEGIVGMSELGRDSGPIPVSGKGSNSKYHGAVFRLTVTFPRFVPRQ